MNYLFLTALIVFSSRGTRRSPILYKVFTTIMRYLFRLARHQKKVKNFALSLINHNQTTSLLDTQVHVSKSGQAYFIFEHLQEVETEARNVCEDTAWTKIRSMLSSKPRPPRIPELRADTTILFQAPQALLPSVMI